MTNLYSRIISIYPDLNPSDFMPGSGSILLQDNSDGNGPYIAAWDHPTLARPTDAQLEAAE